MDSLEYFDGKEWKSLGSSPESLTNRSTTSGVGANIGQQSQSANVARVAGAATKAGVPQPREITPKAQEWFDHMAGRGKDPNAKSVARKAAEKTAELSKKAINATKTFVKPAASPSGLVAGGAMVGSIGNVQELISDPREHQAKAYKSMGVDPTKEDVGLLKAVAVNAGYAGKKALGGVTMGLYNPDADYENEKAIAVRADQMQKERDAAEEMSNKNAAMKADDLRKKEDAERIANNERILSESNAAMADAGKSIPQTQAAIADNGGWRLNMATTGTGVSAPELSEADRARKTAYWDQKFAATQELKDMREERARFERDLSSINPAKRAMAAAAIRKIDANTARVNEISRNLENLPAEWANAKEADAGKKAEAQTAFDRAMEMQKLKGSQDVGIEKLKAEASKRGLDTIYDRALAAYSEGNEAEASKLFSFIKSMKAGSNQASDKFETVKTGGQELKLNPSQVAAFQAALPAVAYGENQKRISQMIEAGQEDRALQYIVSSQGVDQVVAYAVMERLKNPEK